MNYFSTDLQSFVKPNLRFRKMIFGFAHLGVNASQVILKIQIGKRVSKGEVSRGFRIFQSPVFEAQSEDVVFRGENGLVPDPFPVTPPGAYFVNGCHALTVHFRLLVEIYDV